MWKWDKSTRGKGDMMILIILGIMVVVFGLEPVLFEVDPLLLLEQANAEAAIIVALENHKAGVAAIEIARLIAEQAELELINQTGNSEPEVLVDLICQRKNGHAPFIILANIFQNLTLIDILAIDLHSIGNVQTKISMMFLNSPFKPHPYFILEYLRLDGLEERLYCSKVWAKVYHEVDLHSFPQFERIISQYTEQTGIPINTHYVGAIVKIQDQIPIIEGIIK